MALSSIENALTQHIRSYLGKYSKKTLKKLAFIISLISCLCAGSVLLFSLFTPVLQNDLNYSQFQINIIGGFTSIGMYLPLPYLGYLADAHGPVILAIIAVSFFAPAYILASIVIDQNLNFWLLALSFAFIGCATSSLYFTSLLTCTKIYPKSKGLTVSAPVTCYGLSSLIGSQVLKLDFLKKRDHSELDLYITFRFFALLYLILGVFNWVSSSIVSIERDIILQKNVEDDATEQSPLLESQDEEESGDMVVNHEERYLSFLKDISAYILLFSLLTSVGPSEMYITNMGSFVKIVNPQASISDQVSVHAVFSTISRLTLAPLSDILLSKYQISRIWVLSVLIIIGLITQVIIAVGVFDQDKLLIVSGLSGFTYGGVFTLFPTIVLSIWGSELFGSTWGSFMVAPAIGSTGFGLLYALIFDSHCTAEISNGWIPTMSSCISSVYWVTSFSFFISAFLLVFAWKFVWSKGVSRYSSLYTSH